MPDRNGESPRTESGATDGYLRRIGRRRLLQATGATVLGGLAVGAAAGTSDLPHTIVFDGSGSSQRADYSFGVSGSIAPDDDTGAVGDGGDVVDGTKVSGTVAGDVDAYRFSGDLTALDVGGVVSVSIEYGSTATTPSADKLTVVTPEDDWDRYTFTVDGRVEKNLEDGRNSAEENDTVTDNGDGTHTVSGGSGNGYGDSYAVYGDVTSFSRERGTCTIFLNGTETTVADLTGQQAPDDGTGDSDDSTDDGPVDTHTLEIVTPADGSVEYELTTTGRITKDLDAGRNSAEEQNDSVVENDDGTYTVTGLTGNGYGDTLDFEGQAAAFQPRTGSFTLYLDGQEVTPDELVGEDNSEHRLEIVTPEDGSIEYTFGTTGEVEKLLDNGDNSAEKGNDDVRADGDGTYTVTGGTGNGYGDGYAFSGEVEEFEPREGQFGLYLDGQQTTAYELSGEEPPEDKAGDGSGSDSPTADGGPIGGGGGYANVVSRDQADIVVRTRSELASALAGASSGDVVFVAGDTTIDMGSSRVTVPSGVTLASNRGVDDAPGALVYTHDEPTDLFSLQRDSRLTGLRVRGPHPGSDRSGSSSARAMTVKGDGVEIDNNDVWGFSYAGVYIWGGEAHVHHNVVRECNKGGLGYGVSMRTGNDRIEYNYFDHNRHSVATSGENYGYVCRYNHFGPKTYSHVIDMHDPAGVRYEVHNNVVEGYVDPGGERRPGVACRGVPDDVALIEDNWFWNPEPPLDSPSYTWTDEAIIQPETGSTWQNVDFSGNHYGEDAGVTFGDVIPGYDGWRS